jgi:hypothetical protein
MVIIMTNAVAVSIHAVSPALIVEASTRVGLVKAGEEDTAELAATLLSAFSAVGTTLPGSKPAAVSFDGTITSTRPGGRCDGVGCSARASVIVRHNSKLVNVSNAETARIFIKTPIVD